MVRVVDCHACAGVLGLNPGGPKDFSLWNCFSINRLVTYGNAKLCSPGFILELFQSTTASKIDSDRPGYSYV